MYNELIKSSIANAHIHLSRLPDMCEKDAVCEMHIHNELELFVTICGKVEFFINDREFKMKDGDIILVNSRVPHKSVVHKNSRTFFVQFGTDIQPGDEYMKMTKYLYRFINYESEDVVIFRDGTDICRELYKNLNNIVYEYTGRKTAFELSIKASVYNILVILYRNNIIKNPDSFFRKNGIDKILPALEYIDNHSNEEITLEDLSDLIHVNRNYFCRLFKNTVNVSFIEYLNFVRISKAEKLLTSTDMSISEIAYETGFSSLSYFNRIFRKYKLCNPGYYKKIKYDNI